MLLRFATGSGVARSALRVLEAARKQALPIISSSIPSVLHLRRSQVGRTVFVSLASILSVIELWAMWHVVRRLPRLRGFARTTLVLPKLNIRASWISPVILASCRSTEF